LGMLSFFVQGNGLANNAGNKRDGLDVGEERDMEEDISETTSPPRTETGKEIVAQPTAWRDHKLGFTNVI